jgi:hypothetical protein
VVLVQHLALARTPEFMKIVRCPFGTNEQKIEIESSFVSSSFYLLPVRLSRHQTGIWFQVRPGIPAITKYKSNNKPLASNVNSPVSIPAE